MGVRRRRLPKKLPTFALRIENGRVLVNVNPLRLMCRQCL